MAIPSQKDGQQVLRYAFDDDTNRLRTDATLTGTIVVEIDQADDSVAIGDGVDLFTGTTVGLDHGLDVNIINASPLDTRPLDANTDNVAISDGTNTASVTAEGRLNVSSIALFTIPYDAITVDYPTATQEVYQSRTGGIVGSVQQTITINYTDSSKDFISNVART